MLVTILMSSCSTRFYQISTLDSGDVLLDSNEFKYDNSSVQIKYDLWTNGGKFKFEITNRTNDTLFLDWTRSYLLLNGERLNYFTPTSYKYVDSSQINLLLPATSLEVDRIFLDRKLYNPFELVLDSFPEFSFDSVSSPVKLVNIIHVSHNRSFSASYKIQNYMWVSEMKVSRSNLSTFDRNRKVVHPNFYFVGYDRSEPKKTLLVLLGSTLVGVGIGVGFTYRFFEYMNRL